MSDLDSRANTTASRDQPRCSSTEFIENVNIPTNAPRYKTLIGSSTGTCPRFCQTSVSESERVAGRVRSLPTTSPSRDFNHSYRPPPQRPFVPSFEQLRLSRRAKDEEIECLLRPRKAPLPSHLPPEDEAYVDAILTKRGVISKTGREQVADKDIARLRPRQCLNDEIINFYGELILSRSESQKGNSTSDLAGGHINDFVDGFKGKARAVEKKSCLGIHYFSTFFWPKLIGEGYDKDGLAEWTKVIFDLNAFVYSMLIPYPCKFDLFSKDVILIPVNHGDSCWTTAAISFRRKRIVSYDSTGMARSTVQKVLVTLLSPRDPVQSSRRRCASTWTKSIATRRGNRLISRDGST